MTKAEFQKEYPNVKKAYQVGDQWFFEGFKQSADEYAKASNQKVEEVTFGKATAPKPPVPGKGAGNKPAEGAPAKGEGAEGDGAEGDGTEDGINE